MTGRRYYYKMECGYCNRYKKVVYDSPVDGRDRFCPVCQFSRMVVGRITKREYDDR